MKKLWLISIIAGIMMTACQQTPKPAAIDVEAEKAAVNATVENMMSAIKAKDVAAVAPFYAEDALVLGTDPSEFWNKAQIMELWKEMLSGTDFTPEFTLIRDREIIVASDGTSAIAVDQYLIPIYTPNIPWRNVYYLLKTAEGWKIRFASSSLIPKNEDLQKLTLALE